MARGWEADRSLRLASGAASGVFEGLIDVISIPLWRTKGVQLRLSRKARRNTTRLHKGTVGLFIAMLLSGCASGPKMELTTNGIPPERGAGILVADDATALNADVLQIVSQRLGELGFVEKAGLEMRISATDRAATVGAYVADDPTSGSANRVWLYQPNTRNKREKIRSVTLTLTDKASGRETYRVVIAERYRASPDAQWKSRLVRLALDRLSSEGLNLAPNSPG